MQREEKLVRFWAFDLRLYIIITKLLDVPHSQLNQHSRHALREHDAVEPAVEQAISFVKITDNTYLQVSRLQKSLSKTYFTNLEYSLRNSTLQ